MLKPAENLSEPCNVRLPLELISRIKQMANKSERSFSGQIRWLLALAIKQVEEREQ
jgi:hypothetical protein